MHITYGLHRKSLDAHVCGAYAKLSLVNETDQIQTLSLSLVRNTTKIINLNISTIQHKDIVN